MSIKGETTTEIKGEEDQKSTARFVAKQIMYPFRMNCIWSQIKASKKCKIKIPMLSDSPVVTHWRCGVSDPLKHFDVCQPQPHLLGHVRLEAVDAALHLTVLCLHHARPLSEEEEEGIHKIEQQIYSLYLSLFQMPYQPTKALELDNESLDVESVLPDERLLSVSIFCFRIFPCVETPYFQQTNVIPNVCFQKSDNPGCRQHTERSEIMSFCCGQPCRIPSLQSLFLLLDVLFGGLDVVFAAANRTRDDQGQ
jgi:hypothetical protein